jgi:thiamine-monophosphate kinase
MERSEDAWIAAIARRFPPSPRLLAGIGDDDALLRLDGSRVVLKTDTVIDGVDAEVARCGPAAFARKGVAVTMSDLAAAGATPRAILVSVVLPRTVDFAFFDGLAEGIAAAAREFDLAVAGGDTSTAKGPLVLTVAAIGEPSPAGFARRSGGRPGDALSVTGALGGSILGRHLTFAPRLKEGRALVERGVAHAMMDLSDGLCADLPRLCAASGCGAIVEAASVPIHPDVARLPADGRNPLDWTPLDHALKDGEDFELLVAHAPLSDARLRDLEAAGVALRRIGALRPAPEGLVLRRADGDVPFPAGGYDHLRPT